MKTANDCRTRDEYHRYHTELRVFLNKTATKRAIGSKGVNAIKKMKRELRSKEHKLAGYIRHGIKSNMLAMTTSPAECHNHHIRHGIDNASCRHPCHESIRRTVTRIQRAFRERRGRAHDELSSVSMFSRAWSSDFLIRKGQALVDRNHARRLHLKCARLTTYTFICWNFDVADFISHPHPLYAHLPELLRVTLIIFSPSTCRKKFAKCNCGQREGVGVACSCFYRIATMVGLTDEEIAFPGTVDIRYWKLFHTHYGTPGRIGDMLYKAQDDAFVNEGKGIPLSDELYNRFIGQASDDTRYPQLGSNTSWTDYHEAIYFRKRDSISVRDIQRYRALSSPDQFYDGEWAQVGANDDFVSKSQMSPAGKNARRYRRVCPEKKERFI